MPRAFTCIDIPEDLAEKLSDTQQEIGIGKPVKPEKMHITLEFFKDISEHDINQMTHRLENLDIGPFELKIKGLGVFPSKKHIRVLWAGAESDRIREVYRSTSKVTPSSSNDHEFHPHVTLSRIKNLRKGQKKKIHQSLEDLSGEIFGEFTASEIKFYESILGDNGSRYREIYVKEF